MSPCAYVRLLLATLRRRSSIGNLYYDVLALHGLDSVAVLPMCDAGTLEALQPALAQMYGFIPPAFSKLEDLVGCHVSRDGCPPSVSPLEVGSKCYLMYADVRNSDA